MTKVIFYFNYPSNRYKGLEEYLQPELDIDTKGKNVKEIKKEIQQTINQWVANMRGGFKVRMKGNQSELLKLSKWRKNAIEQYLNFNIPLSGNAAERYKEYKSETKSKKISVVVKRSPKGLREYGFFKNGHPYARDTRTGRFIKGSHRKLVRRAIYRQIHDNPSAMTHSHTLKGRVS